MTLVDLYNRALDIIGTQSVQTIADTTNEARLCNRNYDNCRRAILRIHPWNFAITRVTLGASTGTPAFDFQYQYPLPTDLLRLTKTSMEIDDWRVEKGLLLTDSTVVQIAYVQDVIDVSLWDPLCFDAVAHYLAWVLSYKITQSQTLKDQVFKDFNSILSKARFIDSTEDPKQDLDIDVWMRSRVGPSQGFVRDPQT